MRALTLVGLSFGYNQNEGESQSMTGRQAVRFIIQVASRGGNVLLNVGPDAAGNIPPVQQRCLEDMARWISVYGSIDGTRRVDKSVCAPVGGDGEEVEKEWVRWLRRGNHLFAYVDSRDPAGTVRLPVDWSKVARASARSLGKAVEVHGDGSVDLGSLSGPKPCCIQFDLL